MFYSVVYAMLIPILLYLIFENEQKFRGFLRS